MTKTRVLLIGGYPKGYNIPFHPKTLSGKRLRKILEECKIEPFFIDLWKNSREEKNGDIDLCMQYLIEIFNSQMKVVALGKHVWNCLKNAGLNIQYLPHPASRRKKDLKKLKRGLMKIGI